MKRLRNLCGAVMLVLLVCGTVHAATIDYDYNLANAPAYTTNNPSAITENFEGALLWNWAGNYAIVTGSVSGKYSAPAGTDGVKQTSMYVTVPHPADNDSSGYVDVTNLGGIYTYFGLWWGSVDTYNTISFWLNGVLQESFTGTDVLSPNPANGNQTAPTTNLYVNFYNLKPFDSFRMSSTNFAFEADNIAVGNPVPLPAAVWLLGAGLVGLVGIRRRFLA